jgi:hypothetical protein
LHPLRSLCHPIPTDAITMNRVRHGDAVRRQDAAEGVARRRGHLDLTIA